jgi:transcriptional regulator with XRE-family HTH domain
MKSIAKWLKASETTQSEFARLLGVDRHQVSRWMNGHKKPNLMTLQKMASVTGLSLETLARDL